LATILCYLPPLNVCCNSLKELCYCHQETIFVFTKKNLLLLCQGTGDFHSISEDLQFAVFVRPALMKRGWSYLIWDGGSRMVEIYHKQTTMWHILKQICSPIKHISSYELNVGRIKISAYKPLYCLQAKCILVHQEENWRCRSCAPQWMQL
jgi:hypothetical protein